MRTRLGRNRRGWTLLEMILALALTTLLLSGIYGAMHLFYRGVMTTRSNVERDQLARTVLRRVSDDLRSAVRYMPVDTSGLSGAAGGGLGGAAAALGGMTGGASSGSGSSGSGSSSSGGSSGGSSSSSNSSGSNSSGSSGGSSGTGSSGSSGSGSSSSGSSNSDPATEETTAPPIPGVYGTSNYLQIDICRLPRPDEIIANANRGTPNSEVRTVSYGMGQGNDPNGLPALIRTEQSRAVALFGSSNGGSEPSDTQVLAAEVASVEFSYFDGTEWLPEWDSTAMGSVPLAIDVRVIMRSPDQQAAADEGLIASNAAEAVLIDPSSVFRLVVHLPAALAPSASVASTTTTEDPATADSGSTTPSTPTGGASASTPSTGSSGGSSGSSSSGGTKGGSSSGSSGTKGGSSSGSTGTKGGSPGGTGPGGTSPGGSSPGGTVPGGAGPGGIGPGSTPTPPTPPATPPAIPTTP